MDMGPGAWGPSTLRRADRACSQRKELLRPEHAVTFTSRRQIAGLWTWRSGGSLSQGAGRSGGCSHTVPCCSRASCPGVTPAAVHVDGKTGAFLSRPAEDSLSFLCRVHGKTAAWHSCPAARLKQVPPVRNGTALRGDTVEASFLACAAPCTLGSL